MNQEIQKHEVGHQVSFGSAFVLGVGLASGALVVFAIPYLIIMLVLFAAGEFDCLIAIAPADYASYGFLEAFP